MTRSHSNSKSHARARPKRESLPNEASVVMMRRVRVGFLYVTLRLNAAAFSNSKTRLLSLVLFFVLIYLYSLHLSSRPRTFLIGAPAQESISKVRFCASFALGRPQRRTLSSTSSSTTQEIISRFLFFVSLFFPPFREFHRRNELGTNQRDLFNDWHLLPNEVHQFLSVFRYREQEEREERFERDAASSDTYHGHCFTYSAACFLLRFCGFTRNKKAFFCAGKIQISSSERVFPGELFVVCYNEREQHTKHRDVVWRRSRDESEEEEDRSERFFVGFGRE